MQAGSITTNPKAKIDFTLPELSLTKIVMWDCHMDDYDRVRCGMIIGKDPSSALGIN